jgi:hypothetical protein
VDISIIFIKLFLEGYYPNCSYIIRDAVCIIDDNDNGNDNDNDFITASCDEEKYPYVERTKECLEILSFFILCIFGI